MKCKIQPAHVLSWDEENAIGYAGGYKKMSTYIKGRAFC